MGRRPGRGAEKRVQSREKTEDKLEASGTDVILRKEGMKSFSRKWIGDAENCWAGLVAP